MGAVATAAAAHGGKVVGIIPKALVPFSGELVGDTIQVDDMHTRKALMNEHADCFVGLPGGFGTAGLCSKASHTLTYLARRDDGGNHGDYNMVRSTTF